jgi:hypothetical protein
MEDVLEVYQRPYDRTAPVVCMDEKSIQLLAQRNTSVDRRCARSTETDRL